MPDYFDKGCYQSRLEQFKKPYGAVSTGTSVQLYLRPRRIHGFHKAVLIADYEFDESRSGEIPLEWEGLDGDRDVYSGVLRTDDYVGLVWYSFRLESLDGIHAESKKYQLTVYDGQESVPDWFGKGMCYQIFPDRFARTKIPDPTGMVGTRTVHRNWDDEPIAGPIAFTPTGEDICNRDFFGGNLAGVMEKLDYLCSIGVETLYFCPIFEAAENHRYGTADYKKIDPMLGDEEEFRQLCEAAHQRGIRVILDGVFNHTGFVSRYFNGDGFYPEVGAYQSPDSPYAGWFKFKHWPNDYDCWWGIYSLPGVEEGNPDYRNYIYEAPDSVVRRWLGAGADGWRLDVADELPDDFISGLHMAVRETKPNAIVIGEVWEDGSNKIAYNQRRRHLLGGHLDGLMNYPFRNALLDYLLEERADQFREQMETLRENYPPFAFYSAMNSMGTHDTLRILTYLGTGRTDRPGDVAHERLSKEQRQLGVQRLKLGFLILFTFPGAPTVYYGDEVGMEGYQDPFNRRTFPWTRMDQEILAWVRQLGALRKNREELRSGEIHWTYCNRSILSFERTYDSQTLTTLVNSGPRSLQIALPWDGTGGKDLISGKVIQAKNGALPITMPAYSGMLLEKM